MMHIGLLHLDAILFRNDNKNCPFLGSARTDSAPPSDTSDSWHAPSSWRSPSSTSTASNFVGSRFACFIASGAGRDARPSSYTRASRRSSCCSKRNQKYWSRLGNWMQPITRDFSFCCKSAVDPANFLKKCFAKSLLLHKFKCSLMKKILLFIKHQHHCQRTRGQWSRVKPFSHFSVKSAVQW